MSTQRFFIGSDGSHKYLVPVERAADWRIFLDGEGDDESDFSLGCEPDYAQRIDGGTLTFTDPQIGPLP